MVQGVTESDDGTWAFRKRPKTVLLGSTTNYQVFSLFAITSCRYHAIKYGGLAIPQSTMSLLHTRVGHTVGIPTQATHKTHRPPRGRNLRDEERLYRREDERSNHTLHAHQGRSYRGRVTLRSRATRLVAATTRGHLAKAAGRCPHPRGVGRIRKVQLRPTPGLPRSRPWRSGAPTSLSRTGG